MKYGLISLATGLVFLCIYFFIVKDQTNLPDSKGINKPIKKNRVALSTKTSIDKKSNISSKKVLSSDDVILVNNENELNVLIENIKVDREKCDNDMQDAFGQEEKSIELNFYTEFEIKEAFQKFMSIKFTSPNMKMLMNKLGRNELQIDNQLADQLSSLRPCRLFQRINFLDEIRKTLSKTESVELKQDLSDMLRKYFESEIEDSYSVANLTMTLNMLESFLQEGLFDSTDEKNALLDAIVDDLEHDYEAVLVSAEELVENDEENMAISSKLIAEEIKINSKFKERVIEFIRTNL